MKHSYPKDQPLPNCGIQKEHSNVHSGLTNPVKPLKLAIAISLVLVASACVDQQNQRPEAPAVTYTTIDTLKPSEVDASDSADEQKNEGRVDNDSLSAQGASIGLEEIVVTAAKRAEPGAVREHESYTKPQYRHKLMADTAMAAAYVASPLQRYASEPLDRENYLSFEENTVKLVAEDPVSTFSVDVDTAAYSNIRRMLLREGRLPPKNSVKVEEMINYFSYNYPIPSSVQQPFSVSTELAPAPWDEKHLLLQVGLKGFEPALEHRPAANLVFLVDVSGSMQSADKLGLVKKSLRLLVNQMQEEDRIALVVYAGAAGLVLDSTPAVERGKIMAAIDSLQSGGSTNGGAGIRLAYDVAQQHFTKGGINRVIIASDGDMNVGTTNMDALKNLVEEKRKGGVALTTLGYGTGNYNYALMEQLADIGNGNAAYIDTMKEAQKVLVDEMQSTLLTIAKDVKIQLEFNPELVAEYRLIGYENRILNREDFRNDKVDAGDIGAGHTVTALYELVLTDSDAGMIPAKRYGGGDKSRSSHHADELAFVRLRYKQPSAQSSVEFSQPILRKQQLASMAKASDNLQFASAVAGFGQLLRGGKYTGQWTYADAQELAVNSKGQDRHGYRGELVSLIGLAKNLSTDRVAGVVDSVQSTKQ